MRSRVILVACLALLFPDHAAAQGHGPGLRSVPLDHWAYRIADEVLLRVPASRDSVWTLHRPWRVDEFRRLHRGARRSDAARSPRVAGWLDLLADEFGSERADPAPETDPPVRYHNRLRGMYAADVRTDDGTFEPAFRPPRFSTSTGQPAHRGIVGHDFALQFREHLLIDWRYVVDTDIQNDPTRRSDPTARFETAAFEVLNAATTVRAGPLTGTVGRSELALGPGRAAAVFVSESIPSMDQIRAVVEAEPIRFTALVAQLSRERPNRLLDDRGDVVIGSVPSDDAPVPFDVSRHLYLHRLEGRLGRHLQLAISEAAVVGGIDRGIELRFANPFVPFFVSQIEDDETDSENVNVVVNLELDGYGPARTRFYGDLYVQEFFVDQAKRDSIGNQLAWRLGGRQADPLGWVGATVGAEYTRVDVFSYLHRGLNTNWTTFGVPLGSSLGPDADQAVGWVDYSPGPRTRFTLDVLARRGGERSVRTLESVIGAGNPEFPSGNVQREWRVGAEGWTVVPDWSLEARARFERRWVENIANEPKRDGSFWRFALDIVLRWSIR